MAYRRVPGSGLSAWSSIRFTHSGGTHIFVAGCPCMTPVARNIAEIKTPRAEFMPACFMADPNPPPIAPRGFPYGFTSAVSELKVADGVNPAGVITEITVDPTAIG